MAIHTLGFLPASEFTATNNVAPNPDTGLTVGGTSWGGPPPAGTTIRFTYESIDKLDVESDYDHFTDDPWNPEWDNGDWSRHKQENATDITIGDTVFAPGTLQLENEYEVSLQGEDGVIYRLVAISAVSINPDHIGDWDYRTGTEHGVIGFTFQGPWPPEGMNLTFIENIDGEQIDWENFVPPERIPCFTAGTMILTDKGEVAVETLRTGDLVMTRDNGLQPVRWIGRRSVGVVAQIVNPNLRPVRIRAGALGYNIPHSDLSVSPQHRILVRSPLVEGMLGEAEALVATKQLLQVEGIASIETPAEVTYVHMLFDTHEVVTANGAETESLLPGPEALKSVGAEAVEEIFALFPDLRVHPDSIAPARIMPSGRVSRKIAMRHAENGKPLVTA